MILAVDVHYRSLVAVAAGVLFFQWEAMEPDREITHQSPIESGYVAGDFYLRELPSILGLVKRCDPLPSLIVVDGYVHLGADQRAGLGYHLWTSLEGAVPIVGVAKTRYRGTPEDTHLLRGKSERPLFVTAVGLDLTIAKSKIASMAGPYRLPTLLKRVDRLCREHTIENKLV